jgi:hypothetical protein
MVMKFHTFYTSNIPQSIIKQHLDCCNFVGVDIEHHQVNYEKNFLKIYKQHGEFLNWMMINSSDDVVCFLDLDCLPYNKSILEKAYNWVVENESFCGNAQNVGHTQMRNHVFASQSMIMIHKKAWYSLGKPNLSCVFENGLAQIDTSQLLTLRADQVGFSYQLLYPIGYDGPEEYTLSGYGKYGKGTLYPGTYHYFALSEYINQIPELWNQRVSNILNLQPIVPNYRSCFYEL